MRRLRASLPLRRVGNFDNSGFRIRARLESGYQSLPDFIIRTFGSSRAHRCIIGSAVADLQRSDRPLIPQRRSLDKFPRRLGSEVSFICSGTNGML